MNAPSRIFTSLSESDAIPASGPVSWVWRTKTLAHEVDSLSEKVLADLDAESASMDYDWRIFRDTPEPPADYVIPGLEVGTVGSIISQGGAGKSFFALQAAIAVASGLDTLDLAHMIAGPIKTGPVLMLSAEDNQRRTHFRVRRILQSDGGKWRINDAQWAALLANMKHKNFTGRSPDITHRHWRALIAHDVKKLRPRLIIFDTLRKHHSLSENCSTEMTQVMRYLEHLAAYCDSAVLFLHHTNKLSFSSDNSGAQQAIRGSSVLTDDSRCQINFCVMSNDEAKLFGIEDGMRKSYVRIELAKTNDVRFCDRWYKRRHDGVLEPTTLTPKVKDEGKGKRKGGYADDDF